MKWEAGLKAVSGDGRKFMVCNADEGDPGAFMDRSLLEGDPHSIIEGMMLGGYAIGASKGYVYVRAEYPIAVERLGNAIDQARAAGILGEHILGSNFSFDLEIRIGAARSSAARRPPCWPPSRANAESQGRNRHSPLRRACLKAPPSSTTWKPWQTWLPSC